MDNLIHYNWHIDPNRVACYLISVAFLSCVIRTILSFFSSWHLHHVNQLPFRETFFDVLLGAIKREGFRERSDFLVPFLLGSLELVAYPILFATGAYYVIGAWIGFKAVAQWGTWKKERFTFNRFLLGNAFVVIVAYLLSYLYVTAP